MNYKEVQSPVEYKSKIDLEKLSLVKLSQIFDDGYVETQKCPIFTGKDPDIEILNHCLARYTSIAKKKMHWDTEEELLENVTSIFELDAERVWTTQIVPNIVIDPVDEVPEPGEFHKAVTSMRAFYAGDDAYYKIKEYLLSRKCMKPKEVKIGIHFQRITELVEIANQVRGNYSMITDHDLKIFLEKTVPYSWSIAFKNANLKLHTTTVKEMQNYYESQKSIMDSQATKKKRSFDSSKSGKGNGNYNKGKWNKTNTSNNNNKSKGKSKSSTRVNDSDPCPIHKLGKHTWLECFDNQYGPNFRAKRTKQQSNNNTSNTNRTSAGHRTNTQAVHFVQDTQNATNNTSTSNQQPTVEVNVADHVPSSYRSSWNRNFHSRH